jgi:hypothetical protein
MVTMTGVAVGVGAGVAVGAGVDVGIGVAVGAGLGVSAVYRSTTYTFSGELASIV